MQRYTNDPISPIKKAIIAIPKKVNVSIDIMYSMIFGIFSILSSSALYSQVIKKWFNEQPKKKNAMQKQSDENWCSVIYSS